MELERDLAKTHHGTSNEVAGIISKTSIGLPNVMGGILSPPLRALLDAKQKKGSGASRRAQWNPKHEKLQFWPDL